MNCLTLSCSESKFIPGRQPGRPTSAGAAASGPGRSNNNRHLRASDQVSGAMLDTGLAESPVGSGDLSKQENAGALVLLLGPALQQAGPPLPSHARCIPKQHSWTRSCSRFSGLRTQRLARSLGVPFLLSPSRKISENLPSLGPKQALTKPMGLTLTDGLSRSKTKIRTRPGPQCHSQQFHQLQAPALQAKPEQLL